MLQYLNPAIILLKEIYTIKLTNYRDELAQRLQCWLNWNKWIPHSVLPFLFPIALLSYNWVLFSDPFLLWRLHTVTLSYVKGFIGLCFPLPPRSLHYSPSITSSLILKYLWEKPLLSVNTNSWEGSQTWITRVCSYERFTEFHWWFSDVPISPCFGVLTSPTPHLMPVSCRCRRKV